LLFTLVDIGLMPVLRWWRWSLGFSMLLATVMQLLVVLRWLEPDASGGTTASSSPIKAFFESPDLGKIVVDPPLSSHRGGGDWERISDDPAFGRSAGSFSGADRRAPLDWLWRPHLCICYSDDLSCSWIHGDLQNPIQLASWVARLLLRLLQASPDLFLAPSFNLRREALFTLPFDGKDAAGDGGKCIAGEVGIGMRTRWRFGNYSRVLCANRKDMVVISFSFWSFLQYCKNFVY
jgi:hypothetical protein